MIKLRIKQLEIHWCLKYVWLLFFILFRLGCMQSCEFDLFIYFINLTNKNHNFSWFKTYRHLHFMCSNKHTVVFNIYILSAQRRTLFRMQFAFPRGYERNLSDSYPGHPTWCTDWYENRPCWSWYFKFLECDLSILHKTTSLT